MMHQAPGFGPNRLPPPATDVPDGDGASFLLCRAGTILCALPTEHVTEIMRPLPLERLAGAPDYVRGLSIVRGAPVPVVDVGLIVGGRPTQCLRLVAVRAASRAIALAVDAVLGITAIDADALAEMPLLLAEAAGDTIGAIGARDADFLVLLRTGRLLPEDLLPPL